MADYRFVTFWQADAPIDDVWEAIVHSERWPQWWPSVERVEELGPGDASWVGATRRMTFKGRLPYTLTFDSKATLVERPLRIDGDAVGELVGTGRWRLAERDGGTLVRYEWDISTSRAWMNALAPIARPIFKANHDWIMRRGARGLAALLGVRVRYAAGVPDRGPLASSGPASGAVVAESPGEATDAAAVSGSSAEASRVSSSTR